MKRLKEFSILLSLLLVVGCNNSSKSSENTNEIKTEQEVQQAVKEDKLYIMDILSEDGTEIESSNYGVKAEFGKGYTKITYQNGETQIYWDDNKPFEFTLTEMTEEDIEAMKAKQDFLNSLK